MNKKQLVLVQILGLLLLVITLGWMYGIAEKNRLKYDNLVIYNNSLKKQRKLDSLTLGQIESDYYMVWEENQIFSSMLSEIENEPHGHEILKKLWDKSIIDKDL